MSNSTLAGFLEYAESRNPKGTINHDAGWRLCAVGDYLSAPSAPKSIKGMLELHDFVDTLEAVEIRRDAYYTNLAHAVCNCEDYGSLVTLLKEPV